jgi:hypothetical protein
MVDARHLNQLGQKKGLKQLEKQCTVNMLGRFTKMALYAVNGLFYLLDRNAGMIGIGM